MDFHGKKGQTKHLCRGGSSVGAFQQAFWNLVARNNNMKCLSSSPWNEETRTRFLRQKACNVIQPQRQGILQKKQVSIFMPAARILICWIMMPCFWYSHERYQDWKKSHLIPPFECVIHWCMSVILHIGNNSNIYGNPQPIHSTSTGGELLL